MDLMAGAGAFATIVGLLCNFKSDRSSGNLDQFILWLKEKRHEDVAAGIENNKELLQRLTEILSTNHEELIEKLSTLDQLISSVAANIQEFSGLALTIHPQASISDQAVSVLRQLVNSGAKLFMEHKLRTGKPNEYILLEGAHGQIEYKEPRFIEDDLNNLVELGLVRLEFGSQGSRRFCVTRNAVDFIHATNR